MTRQVPSSSVTQRYWIELNLALRAMPNLRKLVIHDIPSAHDPHDIESESQLIGTLLAGCTFRLRIFTLTEKWAKDASIAILQDEQLFGELEELCVHWPRDIHLPTMALPRLTVLTVSSPPNSIPTLVSPPRRVKALSWTPDTRVRYNGQIDRLQPYPALRSLSLVIGVFDFKGLARAFPSLRFLSLDHYSRVCFLCISFLCSVFPRLELTRQFIRPLPRSTSSWKSFFNLFIYGSLCSIAMSSCLTLTMSARRVRRY